MLAGFVDVLHDERRGGLRSEECLVWLVAGERKCGQREWVLGSGGGS